MKYIWINPVTAHMYEPSALQAFLKEHSFLQAEASSHWLETVRKKYEQVLEQSEKTLIDVRCPKIRSIIHAYDLQDKVILPDIEPILIHCGREISENKDLQGTEKVITTPCQALADLGNSLGLKETTFLPWNQFLSALGDSLSAAPTQESPIPPGFFEGLHGRMCSVTGKESICDLLESFRPDQFALIEMLYCKDGCHNGDGICK